MVPNPADDPPASPPLPFPPPPFAGGNFESQIQVPFFFGTTDRPIRRASRVRWDSNLLPCATAAFPQRVPIPNP